MEAVVQVHMCVNGEDRVLRPYPKLLCSLCQQGFGSYDLLLPQGQYEALVIGHWRTKKPGD